MSAQPRARFQLKEDTPSSSNKTGPLSLCRSLTGHGVLAVMDVSTCIHQRQNLAFRSAALQLTLLMFSAPLLETRLVADKYMLKHP